MKDEYYCWIGIVWVRIVGCLLISSFFSLFQESPHFFLSISLVFRVPKLDITEKIRLVQGNMQRLSICLFI
jgi:hypothetical protein